MVVGNIVQLDRTRIENMGGKIMEEKLLDILAEICGDDIVKEDRDINIVEEDLMDSLDFTELLVEIEGNFGVSIPPTEVTREDMDTPNKIIALIKSKQ